MPETTRVVAIAGSPRVGVSLFRSSFRNSPRIATHQPVLEQRAGRGGHPQWKLEAGGGEEPLVREDPEPKLAITRDSVQRGGRHRHESGGRLGPFAEVLLLPDEPHRAQPEARPDWQVQLAAERFDRSLLVQRHGGAKRRPASTAAGRRRRHPGRLGGRLAVPVHVVAVPRRRTNRNTAPGTSPSAKGTRPRGRWRRPCCRGCGSLAPRRRTARPNSRVDRRRPAREPSRRRPCCAARPGYALSSPVR